MDAAIFPQTHLKVKFDFKTYSNKKNFTLQNDSKLVYKQIGEKKIHSIDSLCLQNGFEKSKSTRKIANTHLKLNLLLLECFLVTH